MFNLVLAAGILICLALSAFFSGSEMAFSSANTIRLENLKDDGNRKAEKALKVTEKFDDALSAILIGNNLVNIASSSMASMLVIELLGENWSWLATLVMTVLVIIFGETIPKISAKKSATSTSLRYSPIIIVLMYVLKPVVWLVVNLTKLITLPLKGQKEEPNEEESVEELQSIIETAGDEGILDKDDTELIRNAIDFSEISASEVMTARVDVQAIDIDDPWEDTLDFLENTPYSRIPVYEDSIDNVIGVLHLNRFFKALSDSPDGKIDIKSVLMPPCFVYKTMKLPSVLSSLRGAKQHLAIVTDEYSGTLGVVSMEDVLEQIVGEIWDETDEIERDIIRHTNTEFEADGDLPISEFVENCGISEEDFEAESETLGGWTVEMLDRFPKVGDSFSYTCGETEITVDIIGMEARRVARVLVRTKDASEA